MVDIFSSKDRSDLMGRIRSHGNKTTELKLIEIFKANRIIGWRRKQDLMGKPDFVFRREKVCVFVDGCFWHGCPKCYRAPRANQAYWAAKIERNRARDRRVSKFLKAAGWKVLRIWEHQLMDKERGRLIARLQAILAR